jgi:hypothetical protein
MRSSSDWVTYLILLERNVGRRRKVGDRQKYGQLA